MSHALAFSENRDTWGVASQPDIAPANELPRGDGALMEGVGRMEMSFAAVEGAQMNRGDVGFFGSQVAQTIGEVTSSLFDFARDKSQDGPEAQQAELVEELQRTAPKPGPAVLTLG